MFGAGRTAAQANHPNVEYDLMITITAPKQNDTCRRRPIREHVVPDDGAMRRRVKLTFG